MPLFNQAHEAGSGLTPHWRCPQCGSGQRGAHRYCSNCGRPAPVSPQPSGSIGCSGCLGAFLTLAILGSCGGLAFSVMVASCFVKLAQPSEPSSYQGTVSAVSWERVIEIERNDPRPREGTKEEIPPDAIDVERKGRTKIFTYKVREWGLDRTLRANGTDHEDIRWPVETDANATKGLERDPNEREARRENYWVSISFDKGQIVRFAVPDETRFRKFPRHSKHTITNTIDHVLVDRERYNK